MSNLKALPDEVSSLYPSSNDWSRDFPWSYAKNRNDCYETVSSRNTYGEQKVRVTIPRSFFWNAQAALWDIANQLRRTNNAARHRQTIASKKRG
jgi:hypothetical protein